MTILADEPSAPRLLGHNLDDGHRGLTSLYLLFFRLYEGVIRLYEGFIKTLLRLY